MGPLSEPRLATGVGGLTSAEAAERLARDGPNELPAPRPPSPWMQLLRELVHFFALMLWVAALLAWIADMPQLSVAIVCVVLINAVFAFAQQRRSDHAAQRLRALLPRRIVVRRDGELDEIDAREVVVDDLLVLGAGDRIPADGSIRLSRGLRVDRSMLTGESAAEPVDVGAAVQAGTFVVDGEGEAEVTATGRSTRLAQIADLTTATHRPQRPLTTELNGVVRSISVIAVCVGVAFSCVSLLLGGTWSDSAVLAIGVTVALVPEGLLPTVTLSLAIGAQRMAHRNALVRDLYAVETLGSTTFICTDKTGTLTLNSMEVVELWTPDASAMVDGRGYSPDARVTVGTGEDRVGLEVLATAAARCGTGRARQTASGWVAFGDPMEAALDAAARRLGIDIDREAEAAGFSGRPFIAGKRGLVLRHEWTSYSGFFLA